MFIYSSQSRDVFLLLGASVLFLSGLFVVYFAVSIGDAGGTPKLGIADIRHECSLITDDEMRAGCLQKTKSAEATGAALQ